MAIMLWYLNVVVVVVVVFAFGVFKLDFDRWILER